MTDNQVLEQRQIMRDMLIEEISGLKNDYIILLKNHGDNRDAVNLMITIKQKITACENLMNYYEK